MMKKCSRKFQKNTFIGILVILCFFFSCTKELLTEGVPLTTEIPNNITAIEQELLALVNQHRNEIGINALEYCEIASYYAAEHTDYMISKETLSHAHFTQRATKIANEVAVENISENVARNFPTAAQAVDNWLTSPSHKKAIEGNFSHTGISIKEDANGNQYFTQIFYR